VEVYGTVLKGTATSIEPSAEEATETQLLLGRLLRTHEPPKFVEV